MKVFNPAVFIVDAPLYSVLSRKIENIARVCYKSEDKIKHGSDIQLIDRLIKNGHHAMIEHDSISVLFSVNRGITHEIVRHRLCSFAQSSTRYCNYSGERFGKEISVIEPMFFERGSLEYQLWYDLNAAAEQAYMALIEAGATPQQARDVLPHSLQADIVVTANIREWRTIFGLRCDLAAHPQMLQVMLPLLDWCINEYPVFFEDMKPLLRKGIDHFESKRWRLASINAEQTQV
jgi:thymidylate synthase (FAD)